MGVGGWVECVSVCECVTRSGAFNEARQVGVTKSKPKECGNERERGRMLKGQPLVNPV